MNIFIDLGCHDGDTVEEFRNWSKLAFPYHRNWLIHAFDPNPKFNETWKSKSDISTFFHQEAAWIRDGTIEVAIDQSDAALGTTVMPGKEKIWDNSPKMTSVCFDFPNWIKAFADDFVVVKMDIEGAEFPVLERMLKIESATIPEVILVEFHPNKVKEYTTDHKNELLDRLAVVGANVMEWH